MTERIIVNIAPGFVFPVKGIDIPAGKGTKLAGRSAGPEAVIVWLATTAIPSGLFIGKEREFGVATGSNNSLTPTNNRGLFGFVSVGTDWLELAVI